MGISPAENPPIKWSETENVKWKIALTGDGSNSSPIIWQNNIIFQTAVASNPTSETPASDDAPARQSGRGGAMSKGPSGPYKFNVVCLNKNDGSTLWEKTVCEATPHEGHHPDHGFASYSPVTDGSKIWANFGSRGVYCLDMAGNILWNKDLGKVKVRAGFGEGGSPSLAGDNLIVLMDQEDPSCIYALNKETGEIAWKQPRDEQTTWTTPIITTVNGKMQAIVVATNRTRAYDCKTGQIAWECGGQTQNVIPTPVLGFDMVFCTSGFRGAALQAIKLGKTGDLTDTDAVVWQVKSDTPYVPSPLLYGEKLYVCAGNNPNISCYNAKTGKPYYSKHNLDQIKGVYASAVGAADRVYFTGKNGVTYVLKNSDTPEVLSINTLDDKIDCSMAVSGNDLFLKGKKNLYCISESNK